MFLIDRLIDKASDRAKERDGSAQYRVVSAGRLRLSECEVIVSGNESEFVNDLMILV